MPQLQKKKDSSKKNPLRGWMTREVYFLAAIFFQWFKKVGLGLRVVAKKNSFTPPVRRFLLLLSFLAWNIAILFGFFPCFKKVTKRMRNYDQIYGT